MWIDVAKIVKLEEWGHGEFWNVNIFSFFLVQKRDAKYYSLDTLCKSDSL